MTIFYIKSFCFYTKHTGNNKKFPVFICFILVIWKMSYVLCKCPAVTHRSPTVHLLCFWVIRRGTGMHNSLERVGNNSP